MNNLKDQIIRLFLRFGDRFTPLKKSRHATLGGKGNEAAVWKNEGVPQENGWLVERGRKSGRKLVSDDLYCTHNQLRTFAQILDGYGPARSYIDRFHLDLCGTLTDKAVSDFGPVLPLIFKSKGRCLAITVADSRRNRALDNWPEFASRGRRMFGTASLRIYESILAVQKKIPVNPNAPAHHKPFDPQKAAKREFGLLVAFAELLESYGFEWTPSIIERHVYVSHYSGRASRMRTYFFRFDKNASVRPALSLARCWTGSKLFYSRAGEMEEVTCSKDLKPKSIMKGKTTKEIAKPSKLFQLVELLGGEFKKEYSLLVAKNKGERSSLVAQNKMLEGVIRELQKILGTAPTSSVAQNDEVSDPVRKKAGRPAGVKNRRKWENFTEEEQIEWLLKVLEARMNKGKLEWRTVWADLLKEKFGYYDKRLGWKMRSVIATTCGKFREGFRSRVAECPGGETKRYLDRLDKIPAKVPNTK